MLLTQMMQAVNEAESEIRRVEHIAGDIAELLQGRLRNVRRQTVLKRLKAELQSYNAHTGKWKEQV